MWGGRSARMYDSLVGSPGGPRVGPRLSVLLDFTLIWREISFHTRDFVCTAVVWPVACLKYRCCCLCCLVKLKM